MTLEDHTGDIIRKSRQAAGLSSQAAAQAAGLTVAQYEDLEQNGQSPATPDYPKLAQFLGLDAAKLTSVAAGWTPQPVSLEQWRNLLPFQTSREGNTVNCYLVWDEATLEAALFDTGWEPDPIFDAIDKHGLNLSHLFITHHHHDHVAALDLIRNKFPAVRIHTNDAKAPADQKNRPNDSIHVGRLRVSNRPTPGHSEDGVTYLVGGFPDDAPMVAVVGDAIFAGSMGRGFHSTELLRKNVSEQILTLPSSTLLCPGHGPLTTVAEEQSHNPFF